MENKEEAAQPQEVKVDPAYEFEAPKYIEFGAPEENAGAVDEWFGSKEATELKTDDLFASSQDFGEGGESKPANKQSKKRIITAEETSRPAKKIRPSTQSHNSSLNHSRGSKNASTLSTSALNASKVDKTMNNSTWVPKLTVPQSPMFATKFRLRGVRMEDSETAQQRYMATSILNQAKRRRLNSMSKKKALYCSAGYFPSHSAKPLTEPEEFQFLTDARLRAPQPKVEEQPQAKPIPEWQGVTVPEAFVFNTDFRTRPTEANAVPPSPFKSFKQKMLEIQNKTPKRFRTRPRTYVFGQSPNNSYDLNLTMPIPFEFETSFRTKPSSLLSREQQEEQEMLNMPKFRANPVNKRVLESDGQVGISRVAKQPLTEPQAFALATEGRAIIKEASKPEEPEPEHFKARPLDVSVLHGPVKGVHAVERPALTVPESPCLLTKTRSVPPALEPPKEVFVFKAKPVPVFQEPRPVVHHHEKVEPIPFNLSTEARGKEASAKLAEKLQQEREAEQKAHQFKAQPMIVSEAPVAPMRSIIVTQPQPFALKIEERGADHKKKFNAKVQDEMKENLERTNFKATLFVPNLQPYAPHKSTKELTVIEDFVLNSDARAIERHTYDLQQDEKAKAAEEVRKQQEQERLAQEAEELKLLRAKMVPKAQPILLGKPLVIRASTQALTQPHTPKLRTRQRSHAGRDL